MSTASSSSSRNGAPLCSAPISLASLSVTASQPPPVSTHARAFRIEPSARRKDNSTKARLSPKTSGTVAETGVDVGGKACATRFGEESCAATARQPKSTAQTTRISGNRIRRLALPDPKDRFAQRFVQLQRQRVANARFTQPASRRTPRRYRLTSLHFLFAR